MGEISAELPWPPSVNRYYRHVGYKVLISREGRQYRRMTVSRLGGTPKLNGRRSLYADFYPPDNRRRDLDNVGGKCFLDSLQAAGLFDDDNNDSVCCLALSSATVAIVCTAALFTRQARRTAASLGVRLTRHPALISEIAKLSPKHGALCKL